MVYMISVNALTAAIESEDLGQVEAAFLVVDDDDREEGLHYAAHRDCPEIVNFFLEAGVSLDYTRSGRNAFDEAVQKKHDQVVQKFLDHQIPINIVADGGMPPLCRA